MVRPHTLHPVSAILHAAPEVSAAHNNGDLNSFFHALLDHIADLSDHIKVQPTPGVPGQCFAADLEQHTFILRFAHIHSPFMLLWAHCAHSSNIRPLFYPNSLQKERGNL